MSREESQEFPRCANCDIEVRWGPTIVGGKRYCCSGCARGGPCSCDYSELPTEPIVLDAVPAGRGYDASERFKRR